MKFIHNTSSGRCTLYAFAMCYQHFKPEMTVDEAAEYLAEQAGAYGDEPTENGGIRTLHPQELMPTFIKDGFAVTTLERTPYILSHGENLPKRLHTLTNAEYKDILEGKVAVIVNSTHAVAYDGERIFDSANGNSSHGKITFENIDPYVSYLIYMLGNV